MGSNDFTTEAITAIQLTRIGWRVHMTMYVLYALSRHDMEDSQLNLLLLYQSVRSEFVGFRRPALERWKAELTHHSVAGHRQHTYSDAWPLRPWIGRSLNVTPSFEKHRSIK